MPAPNSRSHIDHRPGRLQPPPSEPTPSQPPTPTVAGLISELEARINELRALILSLKPLSAGQVIRFAAPALDGFLICDGALYKRADFPALFAVIGTQFNRPPDPADSFRVPTINAAPNTDIPWFIKT